MPSVSSPSLLLSFATEKISRQTERADAAERKCVQLASQLRSVCEQRESLQLQLDKAHSELGLYRIQLDLAQKEIQRAEEVVSQVDRARLKAEEQAARNRSKVRQLIERAAVNDALQQGRESGFKEGLERGKILALSEMMLARHNGSTSNGRSRRAASYSSSASTATTRHSTVSQPQRAETPSNVPPVRPPSAGSRRAHSSSPVSSRQRSSSIKEPRPVPAPSVPRNQYYIPPDGFIPIINPDSVISLPPPHELSRPVSAGHPPTPGPSTSARARPRGARSGKDVAIQQPAPVVPEESPQRPSPPSSMESMSTNISRFEFVKTPHEHSIKDDTTGQSMLLPELPSSLLHIHKLPSPTNSPAIYQRPLRDEYENEQTSPINNPIHIVAQPNGDNIIGIDIESASDSLAGSTSFTNTELGLLTPNPPSRPPSSQPTAPSEPVMLSSNELPPGFVPLSPAL